MAKSKTAAQKCVHQELSAQGDFFSNVKLKNGYRVNFTVYKCQGCGADIGEPDLNYRMALRDGWKRPNQSLN